MNFISHSLIPVVMKQASEIAATRRPDYAVQWKIWAAIAVSGTLPDLLDFHMTVAERWTSFSHTWPTTAAFVTASWLFFLIFRKWPYAQAAPWCGLAYLLHVACDIISGGVDFLQTGTVIGGWWISFLFWPVIDLAFIVLFVIAHGQVRKRAGLHPNPLRILLRRDHD